MESGSQPSMPGGHSLVRPIADEVTIGAKPSTVMDLPVVERRRPIPIWILALGLLLVGGLGAGLAWAFIGSPEMPQPSAAPSAEPAEPGLGAETAAAVAEEAAREAGEAESARLVADESESAEAEAEREAAAAAEEDEAARDARAQRRLRALRRGRRGGDSTQTETTREAQPERTEPRQAERRPRRDDDLVVNPYRR